MKYLLIIILPLAIFSQSIDLSLEDAILKSFENNKSLEISKKKIEASDFKINEQFASHFPTLKLQSAYSYQSEVSEFGIPNLNLIISPNIQNIYATKLTLQQPIFTGWKLSGLDNINILQKNIVNAEYEKEKSELILQVTIAYWNLYQAKNALKLSENNLLVAESYGNDIKLFYSKGLATENDLLKNNLRITNTKVLINEAKNGITLAEIALNNLISKKQFTNYNLTSSPNKSSYNLGELNNYVSNAIAKRKEIYISNEKIKTANQNKNLINSNWYPQIFLQSNYYYSKPNQRYFPLKNEFKDSWDVGILFQFDLWNNLSTYYQSQNAKSQIEQAELGNEILVDGIRLEVTKNYFALDRSIEKLKLSELSIEQATENLRIVKNKLKNDLNSNTEYFEAENLLLQAKHQNLQAIIEQNLAIARFEKSIGEQ